MFNIKHLLLATMATLGAATLGTGCVGELEPMPSQPTPDDPPAETNAAKVLFDDNVASIMTGKCGSCHTAGRPAGNTTGFVDSIAAQQYDTMVGYVAVVGNFTASTAPVLGKIANGHQSITYSTAELGAITAWLDKEVEVRNPATSTPPTTPPVETASQITKRLYKEWSGCMTKTDFDTANMAQGVGGYQATNNQECDNCHATGAEGFVASRDGAFFFKIMSEHTAYMSQYFIVDLSTFATDHKASIIQNKTSILGVSQRQAPHLEHPTFNADNVSAPVTAFFALTAAHAANPATCEVPAGRLLD